MKPVTHEFKFTLFGGSVKMFHEGEMGIVVEKERDVVCVYGTDSSHNQILCAIPLCSPKALKGMVYRITFLDDHRALVTVGDTKLYFDYGAQKCANNRGLQCYGSEVWGNDVSMPWVDTMAAE